MGFTATVAPIAVSATVQVHIASIASDIAASLNTNSYNQGGWSSIMLQSYHEGVIMQASYHAGELSCRRVIMQAYISSPCEAVLRTTQRSLCSNTKHIQCAQSLALCLQARTAWWVNPPCLSVKVCLELDIYSNRASLAAVLEALIVFLFSCVQYYL
jgi:hypothetical protein